MDLETLAASPVGGLVPIRGVDARHGNFAYFAYLPDPLPADVNLGSATWTAVADASGALTRLDQACSHLPDPRLLIRPALWRESLDTSALEGTHAALPEVLEAKIAPPQFLSPEVVEIRAYESVALRAFDEIQMHDREISVGLLNELQGELFAAARKRPRDLGKVREHEVFIGPEDRPIEEARFVPPPGDDRLWAGVATWESWVQAHHAHLPPVLQAAMAHYQFETLHPYGDGNGRLGRLVILLQLLKGKAIAQPAVTLSPWFLKRRQEYQDQLLAMSCTGDWNPWVQFFCRAMKEQCESLVRAADTLREWLEGSTALLHERRWTGTIHQLLKDLLEWPVISITFTAQRYDVTYPTAKRMVEHLIEIGVLRELTGRTYGRMYGATLIMNTVDAI